METAHRLAQEGIVEPASDWEGHAASHPELLDWLAAEFVGHDYDMKYIVRLVLTSQLYQRQPTGRNLSAAPGGGGSSPPLTVRRMAAERVVDSLFAAAGKPMVVEERPFDPGGRQAPRR